MKKIGFHYYSDTDHFQRKDLNRWLPEWKALDVSWLLIQAPLTRAVPEFFLRTLGEEGIEPVLQFKLPLGKAPEGDDLELLFESYARWGVNYVVLFDRPNVRSSWGTESWAQSDLVERFLDSYLPAAQEALTRGLRPVFPPLEPGGDYWDTMFLRAGLEGLKRRAPAFLLERLVLSACANGQGRPLDWGVGGPERWPEVQPYLTPEGGEDQRGFRIADWYLTLSEAVLEQRLPVMMFDLGGSTPPEEDPLERTLNMVQLLEENEVEGSERLPSEILCGMFSLVDEKESGDEAPDDGWFHGPGQPKPVVDAYLSLRGKKEAKGPGEFQLKHYLLLPTYDWGVADWHLEVTRAYIKRYRPTVGFSLQEARRAEEVTVVGGGDHFSEEDLNQLRAKGSVVRRVAGNGTDIAAQLAAI